jgi:NAD+ diphosphatase
MPSFDRAAHRRTDLAFLEAQLEQAHSRLLPVWRGEILLQDDRLLMPSTAEAQALIALGGELVWLGTLGDASCFALDVGALDEPLSHPALHGAELKDLRFAGAVLQEQEAALALYARGILYWHSRQRYCGVCGGETAPRDGGHTRECRRQACGEKHFPRTDPAIIVLVSDGDRCLVGRQARWPRGMYSTLAGFVEPGESMEQAVVREVLEESGIVVGDVQYFRSQPWPFPASLMIGFTARAHSSDIRLGDDELEDARWVTREQLQHSRDHGFYVPGPFSLAGQLLSAFVERV